MKTRSAFLFLTLAVLLVASAAPRSASAQTPFRSATLSGMGGGGPAAATQVDALLLNPANLASAAGVRSRTTLSFAPLAARGGGSLLQTGFYDRYLTGGDLLSDRDVDVILDEWFGTGIRTISASGDALLAGFANAGPRSGYGGAVRLRSATELGFNRGLPELVLKGTAGNRTFPLDARVRSYSAVEVSGGYGWHVGDRLAVGVAPKLVAGLGLAEMDLSSSVTVTDSSLVHRFDYTLSTAGLGTWGSREVSPFSDEATSSNAGIGGWGAGADLGATYLLAEDLTVSASVTDLGAIGWSGDPRTVTPQDSVFRFEGLSYDRRRIREEYDGDAAAYFEHVLDSVATGTYEDTNVENGSFVSALPTAVHVGGRWEAAGPGTYLAGGVSVGLARTGGLSRTPSVYAGGQYRLGGERFHLPFRLGVRVGGKRALGLGAGTGFRAGPYELGVGATVTPRSDLAGGGYEVAVATAALTFHL